MEYKELLKPCKINNTNELLNNLAINDYVKIEDDYGVVLLAKVTFIGYRAEIYKVKLVIRAIYPKQFRGKDFVFEHGDQESIRYLTKITNNTWINLLYG